MTDHVYERKGDVFAPTEWAGSPWSAEMQHGPPPPLPLEGAVPVEFMPRAFRDSVPPGFHWSFEVRMGGDEHGAATGSDPQWASGSAFDMRS